MNEKEVITKLFELKEAISEIEIELAKLVKEYERIENDLHEEMLINGQTKTGTYEGIGGVVLKGYKTFASVLKENEVRLFDWLKQIELGDIIKPTIHHSTLSAVISNMIEEGKEVPEFVNIYRKPKMSLVKK